MKFYLSPYFLLVVTLIYFFFYLAGPEDCYFSLGNAVKEIKEMERIDTFDFPYAMNSYQILVNLSTSNSRLDCPSGTVAFIAYCGKYYTFYFIFNCLNNVISIILQIIIV